MKTIYRLPQNLGGKFQGLMERHDERQDVGRVFKKRFEIIWHIVMERKEGI